MPGCTKESTSSTTNDSNKGGKKSTTAKNSATKNTKKIYAGTEESSTGAVTRARSAKAAVLQNIIGPPGTQKAMLSTCGDACGFNGITKIR